MDKPIRRDYTLGNYLIPEDCQGGVAVDIGANIGNFAEKYSDVFSKIDFYEPILSCYELCVKKSEGLKNVRGFHECVSASDGEELGVRMNGLDPYETGCVVDMPHLKAIDPNNKVFKDPFEKTKSVSLETVLARAGGRVDYLKVDCEGSEYYVLNRKDLSSVKYIAVEFHGNLGQERWKELCLWLNRTHMIVHPQIVKGIDSYLILSAPIIEVLYAPRVSGMKYVRSEFGFDLVSV